MNRILYLLLALSLGLNAGLLGARLARRPGNEGVSSRDGERHPRRAERPPPREARSILEDHIEGMTRHVALTPEQQHAIREVLQENMPRITELRRNLQDLNQAISRTFAAAELDRVEFNMLVRRASATRAEIDSLSAVMLLGEAAVLNPEQRKTYAEVAPTIHADPQRTPPPEGGRSGPREQ